MCPQEKTGHPQAQDPVTTHGEGGSGEREGKDENAETAQWSEQEIEFSEKDPDAKSMDWSIEGQPRSPGACVAESEIAEAIQVSSESNQEMEMDLELTESDEAESAGLPKGPQSPPPRRSEVGAWMG